MPFPSPTLLPDPANGSETPILGRAIVLDCEGTQLEVQLPDDRRVEAQLAVPYGYRPTVGDELVVISQHNRFFVIGVTKSVNGVELRFNGDVELRSTNGSVALNAAKSLQLMASEIETRSKVFTMISDKIVEKAATIYQRATELLSLQAGQKEEVIEGESSTRAEHIHLASEELIKVNGKEIHLG